MSPQVLAVVVIAVIVIIAAIVFAVRKKCPKSGGASGLCPPCPKSGGASGLCPPCPKSGGASGLCPPCPKSGGASGLCPPCVGPDRLCPPCPTCPKTNSPDRLCPPCVGPDRLCPPCVGSDRLCPPCPKTVAPEVYLVDIGVYGITEGDISSVAATMGAKVATANQLVAAYYNGADWCHYGWANVDGGYRPYLIVHEKSKGCGGPGLVATESTRAGLTLYGIRPPESAKLPRGIHVFPWNGSQWSQWG